MIRLRAARSLLLLALVPPAGAETIRIGGRVLAPQGTPLTGAVVTLSALEEHPAGAHATWSSSPEAPTTSTATDEKGRFTLTAPGPGLWKLRVDAAGFVPLERRLVPLLEPLELDDAILAADVGFSISVVGPTGEAISGAFVAVEPETLRWGREPAWRPAPRRARTGPDGTARLPRAEAESVDLSLVADRYAVLEVRGHRGTAIRSRLRPGKCFAVVLTNTDGVPVPRTRALVGPGLAPLGETDDTGRLGLCLGQGEPSAVVFAGEQGVLRTKLSPPATQDPMRLALPTPLAVVGKVIDEGTRGPAAGAVVWDTRQQGLSARVDVEGGFVLWGTPGQLLALAAGAPGYLEARPFEFVLRDDGRPGPALVLRPAAAIAGRVVDAQDRPIHGADVALEAERPETAGRMRIEIGRPRRAAHTATDDQGRFRLGGVDPSATWELVVRAEGFAPSRTRITGLEATTTRSDLRVVLLTGHSLTGTIVDGADRPIAEAQVRVRPSVAPAGPRMMRILGDAREEPLQEVASDGEGQFAVRGLAPGKFELEIRRRGFETRKVPGVEVRTEEDADIGRVVLAPGQPLVGVVRDRAGAPIEGVAISVRESGPALSFVPAAAGGPAMPDALSDATGFFSVPDLGAGPSYTVEAQRSGYVAATASAVKLPLVEPLAMSLEPASDISGRVLDSRREPMSGARVVLRRSRTIEIGGNMMRTLMVQDAVADHEGRFRFEDQEPGTISLVASASGHQEATLDNIAVPSGRDLADLELTLPAGAILEGRVRAPDGRAALGATVRPVSEGAEPLPAVGPGSAGVDGNGFYRLESLAPGRVSIEALHEDYPRVVRDVEVREGRNSLDLLFEGGADVAGHVRDDAGRPIAGAHVSLVPAGRAWGGPEGRSDVDGAFRILGVRDGEWRVQAQAPGHAPADGSIGIRVEGAPVEGVEIALGRGGHIAGRIRGIEPERLSEVIVEARGGDALSVFRSAPDFQGAFRIENLPAGAYEVVARQEGSGRRASGRATVEADAEARVDLVFGGGVALSGTAWLGDAPLGGATVMVAGIDDDDSGWTTTNPNGQFAIEGLRPGSYRVELREFTQGLAHSETVQLATNREIELRLPVGRVAGSIVDGADRRPLPGVSVLLQPAVDAGNGPSPPRAATTDLEGRFVLPAVADGQWRLAASKKGYAARTETVSIRQGRGAEQVRLQLEATEGLTFEVRLPSGEPPPEVQAAVLDGTGGLLTQGTYATGEGGSLRLSTVPPGEWTVVLAASGAASSSVQARAPAGRTAVALPPPTRLSVEVPSLEGSGSVALVRVRDTAGRPYRSLGWSGTPREEWPMSGGRIEFTTLPPGTWTVEVKAADGRSWQGSQATSAGGPVSLTLE